MKAFFKLLYIIPTICFCQEHSIISGKFFDEIEFGYSTRSDVMEKYKDQVVVESTTNNCYYTDNCGDFYGSLNSLEIKKQGIIFQTDPKTEELINKVLLYAPFNGEIDNKLIVSLGNTTVEDIYKKYPNAKLTSTNQKKYWIIINNEVTFLVTRRADDKEYPIEPLEIYDRLIKVIILKKEMKHSGRFVDGCETPLFAPKIETHKNCYVRKHKGGFHYISWGDTSNYKNVKNGYWKEFNPNHTLKEEGNYVKGKKRGLFKYYDKDGMFLKSKKHTRFLFW